MNLARPAPTRLAALLAAGVVAGGALQHMAVSAPAPAPSDARATSPSADDLAVLKAAAVAALQRKDHAAAIAAAQRYLKAGGSDADVRPLLVQAYHDAGDYANAARELQWEVQSAERAGRSPGEDRLLLLKDCYTRLNDANATAWALEKLVAWHPKRAYWADLLDRTEKRPDFGERLALDVNRLRLLTGTLTGTEQYLGMAAQAQRAGLPAEAKRVVDQGIARGLLGNGPQSAGHRQLQRQLADEVVAQQTRIDQRDVESAAQRASDGHELFNLGFAHATLGNYGKGLSMMEQALRKGGLENRPQDAKLRLGIAYLMSGQKAKAIETFDSVGGRHGAADLGRIWGLYARNAAS